MVAGTANAGTIFFDKDYTGEADCKAWVSIGSAEWITSDLQNLNE